MEIILTALVVIGVIVFIAYPLFNTPRKPIAGEANALDTLVAQRDSAYDAIRDLDFDYQLGKLSQDDYNTLREKYKTRAAQILQHLDAVTGNDENAKAEASIEAEIARLRRTKETNRANDADAEIETQVARLRGKRNGHAVAGDTAIEAQIAQRRRAKRDSTEDEIMRLRVSRKKANQFCANCGTPHTPEDKFCAKCGSKL